MDIAVEWCSLCNSNPADGKLTVEEPYTKEPLRLPACEGCVEHLRETQDFPTVLPDGGVVE